MGEVSSRSDDGGGDWPCGAYPLTPSRKGNGRGRVAFLYGRGKIILYISFQRGAMVASGDRPSPTEAAAETESPFGTPLQ